MWEKVFVPKSSEADKSKVEKMNNFLNEKNEVAFAAFHREIEFIAVVYRPYSGLELNENWAPGSPKGPGLMGIMVGEKIVALRLLECNFVKRGLVALSVAEPLHEIFSQEEIELILGGIAVILQNPTCPSIELNLNFPGKAIESGPLPMPSR